MDGLVWISFTTVVQCGNHIEWFLNWIWYSFYAF